MLRFHSPSSKISPCFWTKLYALKLDEIKLNEDDVNIIVKGEDFRYYSYSEESFTKEDNKNGSIFGIMKVLNKIEAFKTLDKVAFLQKQAEKIFSVMLDGSAIDFPNKLQQVAMLVFADLKKYKFFFWACYPSFIPKNPYSFVIMDKDKDSSLLFQSLAQQIAQKIMIDSQESSTCLFFSPIVALKRENSLVPWQLCSLREAWLDRHDTEKIVFVLLDGSTHEKDEFCLGWMARNILALFSVHAPKVSNDEVCINIFSWRGILANKLLSKSVSIQHSTAMSFLSTENEEEMELWAKDLNQNSIMRINVGDSNICVASDDFQNPTPKDIVGWESNDRGKPGPRYVDLSTQLDPKILLENASSLNLSLIKWRLWQDLQIERIKDMHCLLLGEYNKVFFNCYFGVLCKENTIFSFNMHHTGSNIILYLLYYTLQYYRSRNAWMPSC